MNIENRVKQFIANSANVPIENIYEDLDIVNNIDWSNTHEDEHSFFVEDFIREFDIYVPQYDFSNHIKNYNTPKILIPFLYIKFRFFKKPVNIDNITVKELINIAKNKKWNIK